MGVTAAASSHLLVLKTFLVLQQKNGVDLTIIC